MSYVKPSPQIYEELANAGGVTNATPNLDTCIIGPLYNTLSYIIGNVSSLVQTSATSSVSTTGSIVAGSYSLVAASVAGLAVQDVVLISGAGAQISTTSSATLQATILNISGATITLDTAASTTVTSAPVSLKGVIYNNQVINNFNLPGQLPGQVVNPSSVQVWFNNARVQTLSTGFYGYSGNNVISVVTPPPALTEVTATTVSGSTSVTIGSLAQAALLSVGERISIAGVTFGASAAPYAGILSISGTTVVVGAAPSATVASAAVTRVDTPLANTTTGSNTVTISSALQAENFVVGDVISIAGVTFGAALLSGAEITEIAGTTFTLADAANSTVANAVVTKNLPVNLNTYTNSLRAEPGDLISIAYTNNVGTAALFTTAIQSVVTSSGNNGTIVNFTTADIMPANMSTATTAATTAGSNQVTLTSATGVAAGTLLEIVGAGANNSTLQAYATSITGTAATLNVNCVNTVASAPVFTAPVFSVSTRKLYNNQLVPITGPLSGNTAYSTSTTAVNGVVSINPSSEVMYGVVVTADVHFAYSALRTDKSNQVLTIQNINDALGQLADLSDNNPLGLGVATALANTTGRILAIAVSSDDATGYEAALLAAEGTRMYALVPLTQNPAIQALFENHVLQMSTPQNASWRVALLNVALPVTEDIGAASATSPATGANIGLVGSSYVLTNPIATFITDGVSPGDTVNVLAATPNTGVGTYTVLNIVSNQQLIISATAAATGVGYYISRALTKSQQATNIGLQATTFSSSRVWLIQPDTIGISINNVVKNVPGYYLAAAHGGAVSGFPVQQGFTDIGMAGISNLSNSNFYFGKSDLNTMAGSGVCLYVQETQTSIPYCRHALTTDMSTLVYQEQLITKNWDFLAYFYYDLVKGFTGRWNITTSTLGTIRQTLDSGTALLTSQSLPKIGPPLISAQIGSIVQDSTNMDSANVTITVQVVYPLNYLNIYLTI